MAAAALLDKALLALMLLLTVGYVGINFTADLPRFLVGENLVLAVLYMALAVALYYDRPWAAPATVLLAGFNAGRVSRSIISPEGRVEELALAHLPLLALILLVALLALAKTLRCQA